MADEKQAHTPEATRDAALDLADAHGRPVAGATVAAATDLYADAAGIGLPMFPDFLEDNLRIVTSDSAGYFAMADAPPAGQR